MKKMIYSKQAKIWIDIFLLIGFIILIFFIDADRLWKSFHCIFGSFFLLLMIIHIVQHWKFIKSFCKKKVIIHNKITFLTTLFFVLISLSVLLFIFGFNIPFVEFHNTAGNYFSVIIIIHAIDKSKRFISFFKNNLSSKKNLP